MFKYLVMIFLLSQILTIVAGDVVRGVVDLKDQDNTKVLLAAHANKGKLIIVLSILSRQKGEPYIVAMPPTSTSPQTGKIIHPGKNRKWIISERRLME